MVRSSVARPEAEGYAALRCVALAMVDAGASDDQDQANPMVLSALEEARYVRSPSYGYEDHGSVLSPPIPNVGRWSIHVGSKTRKKNLWFPIYYAK